MQTDRFIVKHLFIDVNVAISVTYVQTEPRGSAALSTREASLFIQTNNATATIVRFHQ